MKIKKFEYTLEYLEVFRFASAPFLPPHDLLVSARFKRIFMVKWTKSTTQRITFSWYCTRVKYRWMCDTFGRHSPTSSQIVAIKFYCHKQVSFTISLWFFFYFSSTLDESNNSKKVGSNIILSELIYMQFGMGVKKGEME